MSGDDEVITAYPNYKPEAQQQPLPGSEGSMQPLAEPLKIEMWDENGKPYLEEYMGSGRLQGKAILLTGGDSGIGRSAALMLAREGASISIAYLPEEQDDAEWVKKAIENAPHGARHCQLIPGDLMDEKVAEQTVRTHVSRYGRIDVLINNASKQIQEPDFAEIDMKNVESSFRSNILAMFALTKYALPHIPRGGCIVNTTSVTAYKGSPAMVDYSATKGAIVTFTRSLSQQLAPKGIRVNAVAPGPVYTPLQPSSRSKEQMEGFEVGSPPLRQRVAQPAELGPSYVFLASNRDSGTMTGQILHVNLGSWTGS